MFCSFYEGPGFVRPPPLSLSFSPHGGQHSPFPLPACHLCHPTFYRATNSTRLISLYLYSTNFHLDVPHGDTIETTGFHLDKKLQDQCCYDCDMHSTEESVTIQVVIRHSMVICFVFLSPYKLNWSWNEEK